MAGLAALVWDNDNLRADLVAGSQGLITDPGLTTQVLISLFTDARARPGDVLPDASGASARALAALNRRGWLGDALSTIQGDRIGSRLWLLSRAKQTEQTRRQAITYANEALAWLIGDGLAASVTVTAAWAGRGILGLAVVITPPGGGSVTVDTTVVVGT
jgi:phage gp46-like protein